MKKEELNYILTGTEDPSFLTEREKVMIDKFLVLLDDMKINQTLKLMDLFKSLVVRGCFRGEESKENRNYNVATNTLKEVFGVDYESELDKNG